MAYNWQLPDWPDFTYSIDEIEDKLFDFAQRVGRVSGLLAGLPDKTQTDAVIDLMVSEAVKTSEIEGEYLSRQDVMSSIRNNLGLNQETENVSDKRAEGAAELMIDVRDSYAEPLTEDKLFTWHRMLMKGNRRIAIGDWRSHGEPMQVVSEALGKEKVYFEAPLSSRVPEEMAQFIRWFNQTGPGGKNEIKKPVLRSAIAHLYFETIHPFGDGNGRIGRAISEKALSQHVNRPILLSLSRSIETNKNAYYGALQQGQQSNEVTSWILYFVDMVLDAQAQAEELIDFTLKKTKFFDRFKNSFNERQRKVVHRMLYEGPKGFEGGISAKKYISITQTSKATATRDMQDLVERGVFLLIGGGGRSTRYDLNLNQGEVRVI